MLSENCTADAFREWSLHEKAFLAFGRFVDCIFAVQAVEDPPLFLFEIPDRFNLYSMRCFIKLDVGLGFAIVDANASCCDIFWNISFTARCDIYGSLCVESVFEDQAYTLITPSFRMEVEIFQGEIGLERAVAYGSVDPALSARIVNC